MNTAIYIMTDPDETPDETLVIVEPQWVSDSRSPARVWLPVKMDDSNVGEWTEDLIRRHWDDLDGDGYPTPEMIAAHRADRVFDAVRAGRKVVDLDVSGAVSEMASDARADARAERRWGHPSLSAGERG